MTTLTSRSTPTPKSVPLINKGQTKNAPPDSCKSFSISGRVIVDPTPNPASGCRKSFVSLAGYCNARFPSTNAKLQLSRPSIEKKALCPLNLFDKPSIAPLMPSEPTVPSTHICNTSTGLCRQIKINLNRRIRHESNHSLRLRRLCTRN